MQPRLILIMAGGTGGHVYPALAVAEYLRQQGAELCWLGTQQGMECELVPKNNILLYTIRVKGLRGNGILRWLLAPFMLAIALLQSLQILWSCKPHAVLGMGGFASGPGGIAARILRIPLYIHEQNAIAGLTNRLLAPFAKKIMQAFPETFQGEKVLTTGNPVRKDILQTPPPQQRFAEMKDRPLRLLILGGSLGAKAINELIPKTLSSLSDGNDITVWHQTGRQHIDATRELYRQAGLNTDKVVAYIDDMSAAYQWADIVLCRAGALTISELSIVGVASILVPFPYAVDDHQTANARFLVDDGCAVLVNQNELSVSVLTDLLTEFCQHKQRLLEMAVKTREHARPEATRQVGDVCLGVAYA